MKQRICIVTPGALGSNPRVVKEADALQAAGYEVTVISTRTMEAVDALDATVLAQSAWRTVRLDFRNSAQRLPHRLHQEMSRWLFLACKWPALAGHALNWMTGPLMRAALQQQAALYIGHYSAGLVAAAHAATHHSAHYAFDAEDFHPGDPPEEPEHDQQRCLLRAIDTRHLRAATYLSAASPGIAEAYSANYGIAAPTVLLNVFPRSQAPAGATPKGTALPGPSLYWFSQTIGPDRGLECAVHALAQTRCAVHLYLRGTALPGFVAQLHEIALKIGVADRLHILPPAAPAEMERLAGAYDLGLVGETGVTLNRKIALTNKLFSYALAGVPALISDIPAHRTYALTAGAAVRLYPVDRPQGLADAIDSLMTGDGTALAAARAHAFDLGQRSLNWDEEQKILLREVAKALT